MKTLSLITLTAMLGVAQIPTPESVLGHKPGDDFYLATYGDALGYFKKLAASSKRVKLVQVGKTTQGRDWYIAFVSTPEISTGLSSAAAAAAAAININNRHEMRLRTQSPRKPRRMAPA